VTIVAYSALSLRPRVFDGAATFSLNVLRQLPDLLPNMTFVVYVRKGETRISPLPNLEIRPVEAGSVARRVMWETTVLGRELDRVGADVFVSPNESVPLRIPCAFVVVAQNLAYHQPGTDSYLGRSVSQRLASLSQAAYYRRRMASTYRRASAVISVSRAAAAVLSERAELPQEKVVVVHEGADSVVMLDPGELQRQPVILVVSTLAPYKNLECALETFALLHQRLPHLRLEVVGEDWRGFGVTLKRLAASLNIAPSVRFAGSVRPEQLAQLYRESAVLLHLSSCESFGLPVAEAMRFGLPVVAANTQTLCEVTRGAAEHVDPTDITGTANAIWSVLDESDRRADLVQRGRARAAELSWRTTAEGIASVVRSLIAAREASR
jgi:glycosyltransferase involved in cell wall biosynthesis